MATLELRNVNKSYGSGLPDTLRNIELSIDSGEFLILVGPSGCGKSTLMNCIAGLEDISGGAIEVDGADISGMSPKDRDIAMVFQSYALYPTMSVRDNIAFGLKMRKLAPAAIDEEVARVARLLQIEHLLQRKPGQLSGGQQQRVAMGRALARRPKIYLFDEPLSNLDAKLRGHMRAELKHMQATLGITTIYVTHDQIEAMTLAHRVAVLEKGVLQQLASPSEIYNNPANLFVAQFIGSPAMNVIHGSLEGANFLTNGAKVKTKVKGQIAKAVAGVRPEDCSVTAAAKGTISGQIFTTELIGDHTLVTVNWGDDQIVVKAHKDFDGKQGDAVGVQLPPENLYIFDETSGERIR